MSEFTSDNSQEKSSTIPRIVTYPDGSRGLLFDTEGQVIAWDGQYDDVITGPGTVIVRGEGSTLYMQDGLIMDPATAQVHDSKADLKRQQESLSDHPSSAVIPQVVIGGKWDAPGFGTVTVETVEMKYQEGQGEQYSVFKGIDRMVDSANRFLYQQRQRSLDDMRVTPGGIEEFAGDHKEHHRRFPRVRALLARFMNP